MALALLLALVAHSLAQPGGPGGPPGPPQPTDVTVFATLSLTGPLAEDAQEALRGGAQVLEDHMVSTYFHIIYTSYYT